MGCTSSAPNTLSANENTQDGAVQIIEDSNGTISKSDTVETIGDIHSAVLPMCDLVETVVKNNRSRASLEFENEFKANDNDESDTNQSIETHTPQETESEEKLTTLEEIVEKIVEINQHNLNDHLLEEITTEDPSSENPEENNTSEDQTPQDSQLVKDNEDKEQENELENDPEEDSEESTGQTEFSHATRWEALADIVAELPPSLAIDPVTGQIYSLAK